MKLTLMRPPRVRAFSLVSVTVALSLLTVLAAGILKYFSDRSKANRLLQSERSIDAAVSAVHLTFQSRTACKDALRDSSGALVIYPTTPTGPILVGEVRAGTSVVMKVGETLPGGAQVESMQIEDTGIAPVATLVGGVNYEHRVGSLSIQMTRTNTDLGVKTVTRKLVLSLLAESATKRVRSCKYDTPMDVALRPTFQLSCRWVARKEVVPGLAPPNDCTPPACPSGDTSLVSKNCFQNTMFNFHPTSGINWGAGECTRTCISAVAGEVYARACGWTSLGPNNADPTACTGSCTPPSCPADEIDKGIGCRETDLAFGATNFICSGDCYRVCQRTNT